MLNPTESITDNMDDLIVKALSDQQVVSEDEPPIVSEEENSIGKIGIWKGSFDRQCVSR